MYIGPSPPELNFLAEIDSMIVAIYRPTRAGMDHPFRADIVRWERGILTEETPHFLRRPPAAAVWPRDTSHSAEDAGWAGKGKTHVPHWR